jgi:hypothetical protein
MTVDAGSRKVTCAISARLMRARSVASASASCSRSLMPDTSLNAASIVETPMLCAARATTSVR